MTPKRPERILAALLSKGSIPHALVFYGMPGVDKAESALRFAMACNCRRGPERPIAAKDSRSPLTDNQQHLSPCGTCTSCQKIKSGNHPDIITIEPSGTALKIDQIRDLRTTLGLKPFEAQVRVVIFPQAESMTTSAANALLKALEEPPAGTVIILITPRLTDLLPTIRSRCQPVRFAPLAEEDLALYLIDEAAIDPQRARLIARLAGGSRRRALQMTAPDWYRSRRWILRELAALPKAPLRHRLALAETLAMEKDRCEQHLDLIKTWLRDLALWQHDRDRIVNQDMRAELQRASCATPTHRLAALYACVEQTQQQLQKPANSRLALELMCLALARGLTTTPETGSQH